MEMAGVLAAAEADVAAARAAVQAVIGAEFLRLSDPDLLSLTASVEGLARVVFTAQVRLAGMIDNRKLAGTHGATSTAALLRQVLQISTPDARLRVSTAAAVHPQDAISGGRVDPVLPLLGAALTASDIGVEQTRTIVTTMTKLPAAVPP